jgi:hypothetical protein
MQKDFIEEKAGQQEIEQAGDIDGDKVGFGIAIHLLTGQPTVKMSGEKKWKLCQGRPREILIDHFTLIGVAVFVSHVPIPLPGRYFFKEPEMKVLIVENRRQVCVISIAV